MHDTRAIVKDVRSRGYEIKGVSQATYLGVDFGCGRMARSTRRARETKHKQISTKIRKFTKASRQYHVTAKLQKQGGLPAGLYGHQVHGVFGQQMVSVRRRLGQSVSAGNRGRCLTTLLDIKTPDMDPAHTLPAKAVDMWLRTWRDHPTIRPS
eukprot:5447360-Pyramimonas_sp.AAC.1